MPDSVVAYLRTDEREATLPTRGDVAIGALAFNERTLASRGSIEATYQASLFASGFGRAYYQGYVDSIGALGVTFTGGDDRVVHTQRGHRRLALGSLAVAGVASATSLSFGAMTYLDGRDYRSTALQRAAHDAQQRYERDLPISLVAGGVAIAGGLAAWYLWPRSSVTLVPSVEHGATAVSLGGRW